MNTTTNTGGEPSGSPVPRHWSDGERLALRQLEAVNERVSVLYDQLCALSPAAEALVVELDRLVGDEVITRENQIAARLVRVLGLPAGLVHWAMEHADDDCGCTPGQ